MLLSAMTTRNTVAAALAALTIATVPAAPAFALGDKEKGFVVGVATALIVDQFIRQSGKGRVQSQVPGFNFVQPQPTYVAPRPAATRSIYGTTAARAFNSYSVSERKAIQRQLRAWGYYRGGIDGAFGPGTYTAITDYARDEGVSGNLATNTGAYGVYDGLLY